MAARAPTAHGQRRREAIIDAAAARFDADGFHGAAIDEICAAAGISGSGLYRHFESKDQLLTAVFDRVWSRLRPAIDAAAQLPPGDALELLIDEHVAFATTDGAALRLLARELRHLPARYQAAARRNRRRYVDAWVEPLRALRPDLDETAAVALVLAVHGLVDSAATHRLPGVDVDGHALLRDAARQLLFDGC